MSAASYASALLLLHRNKDSESSSSSSDEEWEAILQNRGKRMVPPRIVNYEDVVRTYSNNEFKSHVRISRDTFNYLQQLIQDDLIRIIPGSPTISSEKQLMIALWKMATVESYRSVSDRFNVGKATALRAVRRVTEALFKRAPKFIQWPSGDRVVDIMDEFELSSGIPKVIGAIDGTHIKIDAPKNNTGDYCNRKGFHSIQLQLVCDHKMLITHCHAGHPGSVHDSRVLRLSEIGNYLNDDAKFPNDSHILGDGAYKIHQHLITTFKDNGHLTAKQKKINYHHSAARVTVERCIGLLKTRFRSLLQSLPMTRVDLMAEYVVACCVLHNICILQNDEFHVLTIPDIVEENPDSIIYTLNEMLDVVSEFLKEILLWIRYEK